MTNDSPILRRRGRPPFGRSEFEILLPPTSVESGAGYPKWRDELDYEFKHNATPVRGLVSLTVTGSDADRGRSWPALLAPVVAVLCETGMIDGEHLIGTIKMDRAENVPRGWLWIQIMQVATPAVRRRMSDSRRARDSNQGRTP